MFPHTFPSTIYTYIYIQIFISGSSSLVRGGGGVGLCLDPQRGGLDPQRGGGSSPYDADTTKKVIREIIV